MTDRNSVVAIYDTHEQAEKAVKCLQEAGIDMKTCRSRRRINTQMNTSSVTTILVTA